MESATSGGTVRGWRENRLWAMGGMLVALFIWPGQSVRETSPADPPGWANEHEGG